MSAREIKAREQEWQKAFNSGDASGVAQLYAPDARVLAPNSPIVQGRADIEAFVKGFVQTGAQLAFDIITVHETEKLCVAVGRYQMDIPAGDEVQKDEGKFIEVWAKQPDGSWLIVDDTFNSSLPAATP